MFFRYFLSFSMSQRSIFTCFGGADEQSSTPRARLSLFAKKDDVLRWIMQRFRWGGGWGWVGGGLMTWVVDCQQR